MSKGQPLHPGSKELLTFAPSDVVIMMASIVKGAPIDHELIEFFIDLKTGHSSGIHELLFTKLAF